MIGSIFTFLAAIIIQSLAPRDPELLWTFGGAALIVGYPLAVWALIRLRLAGLYRFVSENPDRVSTLRGRYTRIIQTYQSLLVLPFAFLVYGTGYMSLVVAPVEQYSETLGNLLGITPYLATLYLLWWEGYPLQSALFGPGSSRAKFTLAHARMELVVLIPWLTLMALTDMAGLFITDGLALLEENPWLELLYAPVFLLFLGVVMPVVVRYGWGCTPIPAGHLRTRLEGLAAKLGVGLGDVLYWPLLEGRVMTAGIVGLAPRFRYLLITPALANVLTPEELDGVVAHEAGHVRYGHLWFYLAFFAGTMVGIVALYFRMLEAGFVWWALSYPDAAAQSGNSAAFSVGVTAGLLVLLFVLFRLVFGKVSRAFERQADCYALETMNDPNPLVGAFEKISAFSGEIRDLPSWHHGSLGDRIDFLNRAATNREVLAAHNRRVRRTKTALLALVTVFFCLAIWTNIGQNPKLIRARVALMALEGRADKYGSDTRGWIALGDFYQQLGRSEEADHAYRRALTIDPADTTAMNNLAWLLVTTKEPAYYRPEEALRLAQRAAMADPSPHVLDTLAEARFRNGDIGGALAAIEAAIRGVRKGPAANIGYYLSQRDKFLEALEGR